MRRTSFTIPESLLKVITVIAIKERKTRSEVVREAIEFYIRYKYGVSDIKQGFNVKEVVLK